MIFMRKTCSKLIKLWLAVLTAISWNKKAVEALYSFVEPLAAPFMSSEQGILNNRSTWIITEDAPPIFMFLFRSFCIFFASCCFPSRLIISLSLTLSLSLCLYLCLGPCLSLYACVCAESMFQRVKYFAVSMVSFFVLLFFAKSMLAWSKQFRTKTESELEVLRLTCFYALNLSSFVFHMCLVCMLSHIAYREQAKHVKRVLAVRGFFDFAYFSFYFLFYLRQTREELYRSYFQNFTKEFQHE